ncbi:MAG: BCCT family transporter, partial [Pseudomonadales bacterium]
TTQRFGKRKYILGNLLVLCVLTMLFKLNFLQIQWVGALVIGLYFSCFVYIMLKKRAEVAAIDSSPEERVLDFDKIKSVH